MNSPILIQQETQLSMRKSGKSVQDIDPMDEKAMGVTSYNKYVAMAMTLNYIIGTGCFGLPFAFKEAGLALTSICLILGSLLATISMNYTLDGMAWAEGISTAQAEGKDSLPWPEHRLTYRKFDFGKIAYVFKGVSGRAVIQAAMGCYVVGTLWSYASVFASSVANMFFTYFQDGEVCDVFHNPSSGCLSAYYISMAVFSVIVITLVLMDLGEQSLVQSVLSAYRVLALVIMLVTMFIKIGYEPHVIAANIRNIGAFNWGKFGKGFGPSILAINCHFNMPDALQPLRTKQNARQIAMGGLLCSAVFYILLGILGAIAFEDVSPLATLNWANFTGCGSGWSTCESGAEATWFGYVIRIVVLLFPVGNVTSGFPLVGVTMGDNIFQSLPKSITSRYGAKTARNFSRLVAAIPPLILATAFKKLDMILSVSGMFGLLLQLTIPSWFEMVGLQLCMKLWNDPKAALTPFTNKYISSIRLAQALIVLSGFIFVFVLVNLFSQ